MLDHINLFKKSIHTHFALRLINISYSLAVYIFTYLAADFCPEVHMEVVHIFLKLLAVLTHNGPLLMLALIFHKPL